MSTDPLNLFFGIAGICGVIGTVSGIILSVILYLRSQQRKEPFWSKTSTTLVFDKTQAIDGVSAMFRGEQVENLTICKIVFWNAGHVPLDSDDFAKTNPLRIVTSPNVKLLEAKIVGESNSSSGFAIKLDEDSRGAHLQFDFINRSQGVVVQVIHNGRDWTDVNLIGDVKGAVLKYRSEVGFGELSRGALKWAMLLRRATAIVEILVGLVMFGSGLAILLSTIAVQFFFSNTGLNGLGYSYGCSTLIFGPAIMAVGWLTIPRWAIPPTLVSLT